MNNIIYPNVSPGNQLYRPLKKFYNLSWKPPLMEWLKWCTDASKYRARNPTTIGLVCGDNKCLLFIVRVKARGRPVSCCKAIVTREALRIAGGCNMYRILIKIDSQLVINSIYSI